MDYGKNDTASICKHFSKDVSVTNMEQDALKSYMKGKKHINKSPFNQCDKSLMPPTTAIPLIILKTSLFGL